MNEQPMSPNPVGSGEAAGGLPPEQLRSGQNELVAPKVEAAPDPGSSPAPVSTVPPSGATQIAVTADDAVAAVAAAPASSAQTGGVVSAPAVAADVDVIEPEWVDKAEEVVRAHQGDPYGEEEAIEDLQQDYLQKRYGFKVGDPKGDSSKSETA